jgi:prepilin-type processing-associated H-X9-DG protein
VTPKVGNSSYVYVHPNVSRMVQIRKPATTPLAYEPPANHGGRGMNVVFWDGHVEFHVTGPAMQKLQAQIAAMELAAKAAAPATPAGKPDSQNPAGPE